MSILSAHRPASLIDLARPGATPGALPDGSTRDDRTTADRGGWRRAPAWLLELGLVALIYGIYDVIRDLRHADTSVANRHGLDILDWERSWHLAPELSLNHWLAQVTVLAVIASYFYATLHFIVTPAVLVWLYRRHPEHYRSARTVLGMTTVFALVIFWLFPTTPPRLLPGNRFIDVMAQTHQYGWWSGQTSVPNHLGGLSNELAAMPSLHVAWALWCGVLLYRYASRRWVRVLGVLYPIATVFVVLGTGNHYLLDTLVGAALLAESAMLLALVRRIIAGGQLRGGWAARTAHPLV